MVNDESFIFYLLWTLTLCLCVCVCMCVSEQACVCEMKDIVQVNEGGYRDGIL